MVPPKIPNKELHPSNGLLAVKHTRDCRENLPSLPFCDRKILSQSLTHRSACPCTTSMYQPRQCWLICACSAFYCQPSCGTSGVASRLPWTSGRHRFSHRGSPALFRLNAVGETGHYIQSAKRVCSSRTRTGAVVAKRRDAPHSS